MRAHNCSLNWEEKVTSTIHGSSSSSADVPVASSLVTSVSVEHNVQTDALTSTSVGTQVAIAGAIGTCTSCGPPNSYSVFVSFLALFS